MNTYTITSFYQFVTLDNHEEMAGPLLALMRKHHLLGTVILAKEGINGSVCGIAHDLAYFYAYLKADVRLADLAFQETYSDQIPFEKAKIKLRNEIVTMGVAEVDPTQYEGTHVTPSEWNALISERDVLVIDTRNQYEVELGTFAGAISPHTDHFRDFPEYVQHHLMDKKDKKIAMFCTGGIRCEKSTAYLKKLGFLQVYQLQGGIINYLKSTEDQESLWQGSCFVFDERICLEKQKPAV